MLPFDRKNDTVANIISVTNTTNKNTKPTLKIKPLFLAIFLMFFSAVPPHQHASQLHTSTVNPTSSALSSLFAPALVYASPINPAASSTAFSPHQTPTEIMILLSIFALGGITFEDQQSANNFALHFLTNTPTTQTHAPQEITAHRDAVTLVRQLAQQHDEQQDIQPDGFFAGLIQPDSFAAGIVSALPSPIQSFFMPEPSYTTPVTTSNIAPTDIRDTGRRAAQLTIDQLSNIWQTGRRSINQLAYEAGFAPGVTLSPGRLPVFTRCIYSAQISHNQGQLPRIHNRNPIVYFPTGGQIRVSTGNNVRSSDRLEDLTVSRWYQRDSTFHNSYRVIRRLQPLLRPYVMIRPDQHNPNFVMFLYTVYSGTVDGLSHYHMYYISVNSSNQTPRRLPNVLRINSNVQNPGFFMSGRTNVNAYDFVFGGFWFEPHTNNAILTRQTLRLGNSYQAISTSCINRGFSGVANDWLNHQTPRETPHNHNQTYITLNTQNITNNITQNITHITQILGVPNTPSQVITIHLPPTLEDILNILPDHIIRPPDNQPQPTPDPTRPTQPTDPNNPRPTPPPIELPDPTDPDNPIIAFLIGLIVPSETFWLSQFNQLSHLLETRLPYQQHLTIIERLQGVSSTHDGDLSFFDFDVPIPNILPGSGSGSNSGFGSNSRPGSVSVSLGHLISPVMTQIRAVITGITLIALARYNYKQILFLVRGKSFN